MEIVATRGENMVVMGVEAAVANVSENLTTTTIMRKIAHVPHESTARIQGQVCV